MEFKLPDLELIKKEFIEEILLRVVERTPVKTGQAREGWEKTDSGIFNTLPYIEKLEEGSSDQAPNGMLRITLEESQEIFDEIVKRNEQ